MIFCSGCGCTTMVKWRGLKACYSALVLLAPLVCGPLMPRMRVACAGERCKFDLIGVGVSGTPRLWPSKRR
jgi:hypothetical protein